MRCQRGLDKSLADQSSFPLSGMTAIRNSEIMARAFSQKIALMHHGGLGSGPALLRSRQGP